MTQEDKELLLQDLCARLPYGVKIGHIGANKRLVGEPFVLDIEDYKNSNPLIIINSNWLPYLRPLSSMTEEEKKEYEKICELDTEILANHPMNGEPLPALYNSQVWLNRNHFDYRGLIPKGLAIEVTKENNPYKE